MSLKSDFTRRQIFKTGAGLLAAGIPVVAAPEADQKSVMGLAFERRDTVRFAFVGLGGRGSGMLGNLFAIPNVRVTAICDPVKEKLARAKDRIERAGQPAPTQFSSGEHDYENLARRDDIDFIYVATPWDTHVPIGVAAMTAGKHVGLEVPAATTIDDCWKLVDVSEKTRRHCMIMENCCYGENELLILNMVKAGVFGELLYGEAAYDHDLRDELFRNRGEGLWRRLPHIERDGNLYPTHGLGPVANYMGVNRGDRFDYMVSMSSPHKGLEAFRAKHIPQGDPKWNERYRCGDVNTSLIKTVNGLTIMLQHNVTSPRPYSRLNMIQGTKGLFYDYPPRIYVEGQPGDEQFSDLSAYSAKYQHTLWKKEGEAARTSGGHGGMDYLMLWRLVQCIREGLPPDMDVYDAAAWSAPGPLSDRSVAEGSAPVKFPDFTRGRSQERKGTAL